MTGASFPKPCNFVRILHETPVFGYVQVFYRTFLYVNVSRWSLSNAAHQMDPN